MSSPLYRLVRAELRKAGPSGIRVSTLLATLPEYVDGYRVTAGHLRAVLCAMQTDGRLSVSGISREYRGLPLRVAWATKRARAVRRPTQDPVQRYFARVEKRAGRKSYELAILRAFAQHGPMTVRQAMAATGLPLKTVQTNMTRAAKSLGTLDRAKRGELHPVYVYSITSAGQAIVDACAQTMAAR